MNIEALEHEGVAFLGAKRQLEGVAGAERSCMPRPPFHHAPPPCTPSTHQLSYIAMAALPFTFPVGEEMAGWLKATHEFILLGQLTGSGLGGRGRSPMLCMLRTA